MDFEDDDQVAKGTKVNYTLDEDVIVLSDDGEEFPNSQLLDDAIPVPSPRKSDEEEDEEDVKPCAEEEARRDVVSPDFGDSESDSDSIDMIWMRKLSQSYSFIKSEPEDVPEPQDIDIREAPVITEEEEELEEPLEPRLREANLLPSEPELPKPELSKPKLPEPEPSEPEPSTSHETVSLVSGSSRTHSIDTYVPVAESSVPPGRTGSHRSTGGPVVIDAPPMPRRRAHLRGISIDQANYLQANLRTKPRSRSYDRGRKPSKKDDQNERSVLKTSAKEERRARLREISEKEKAETSAQETPKGTKKGTAKVKVTEKLRGDFLTESRDAGSRPKVPTRQAAISKMRPIPKLKNAVATRTRSPLENLSQTFDFFEPAERANGVSTTALQRTTSPRPVPQSAPRLARTPENIGAPAPRVPEVAPTFQPPAPSPGEFIDPPFKTTLLI